MVPCPQRSSLLHQLTASHQPVVKSPPPRSIIHTPADPAVAAPGQHLLPGGEVGIAPRAEVG